MHDLIDKAKLIAMTAHKAAQNFRKISGEDYIVHPADVARIAEDLFDEIKEYEAINGGNSYCGFPLNHIKEAIAAAWLHDTVEDANLSISFLKEILGGITSSMVDHLSDAKLESMSRNERLEAYIKHLNACIYVETLLVKLADIRSNFDDIVASHENADPEMQFKKFRRFIAEKTQVINEMDRVKNTPFAKALLNDMAAFLAQAN